MRLKSDLKLKLFDSICAEVDGRNFQFSPQNLLIDRFANHKIVAKSNAKENELL